jgi:hypothetical protein
MKVTVDLGTRHVAYEVDEEAEVGELVICPFVNDLRVGEIVSLQSVYDGYTRKAHRIAALSKGQRL